MAQWAARGGRFAALAWARVVQWGGGAVGQVGFGLLQLGPWGLVGGATLATAAAATLQAQPAPAGGWRRLLEPQALRDVAGKHKDFPLLNTPHAFAGALQDTLIAHGGTARIETRDGVDMIDTRQDTSANQVVVAWSGQGGADSLIAGSEDTVKLTGLKQSQLALAPLDPSHPDQIVLTGTLHQGAIPVDTSGMKAQSLTLLSA